MTLLNTASCIG